MRSGHLAQEVVAGGMTERIIHLLEAIEVEVEQRHVALAGQDRLHSLDKGGAVRQAGQRVEPRGIAGPRLALLELRIEALELEHPVRQFLCGSLVEGPALGQG